MSSPTCDTLPIDPPPPRCCPKLPLQIIDSPRSDSVKNAMGPPPPPLPKEVVPSTVFRNAKTGSNAINSGSSSTKRSSSTAESDPRNARGNSARSPAAAGVRNGKGGPGARSGVAGASGSGAQGRRKSGRTLRGRERSSSIGSGVGSGEKGNAVVAVGVSDGETLPLHFRTILATLQIHCLVVICMYYWRVCLREY